MSSGRTGVFKYQWAALFTSVGIANGAQDLASGDPAAFEQYVDDNCANFDEPVCQALLEVMTVGYPSEESIRFLRSNSVAGYMRQVRVPTLIGQGQADTLFNLQESIATYTALKRQGTHPDTQLVVFAKLYDIGPDGAIELPYRLISPARVADPGRPFTIELPAIVHRFEPGHRLAVVLAGGDMAYRGSNVRQAVTLTTGGPNVQQLTLPVAG